MLALQCMHDNLLKRHSFCWALHAKWYPSVRIDVNKATRYVCMQTLCTSGWHKLLGDIFWINVLILSTLVDNVKSLVQILGIQ